MPLASFYCVPFLFLSFSITPFSSSGSSSFSSSGQLVFIFCRHKTIGLELITWLCLCLLLPSILFALLLCLTHSCLSIVFSAILAFSQKQTQAAIIPTLLPVSHLSWVKVLAIHVLFYFVGLALTLFITERLAALRNFHHIFRSGIRTEKWPLHLFFLLGRVLRYLRMDSKTMYLKRIL